jgi:hypothetical protein
MSTRKPRAQIGLYYADGCVSHAENGSGRHLIIDLHAMQCDAGEDDQKDEGLTAPNRKKWGDNALFGVWGSGAKAHGGELSCFLMGSMT